MTTMIFSKQRVSALVGAGLLGIALSASAAAGFTVLPEQEKLITPGMTTEQVLQLLGRPSTNFKYRAQPGPSYSYRVVAPMPATFFVDFGADGKVTAVSERLDLYEGGEGGQGGLGGGGGGR